MKDLRNIPLRIWVIIPLTFIFGAAAVRLAWTIPYTVATISKVVLGLSFVIVISGYVFLLRILIRPNSIKLKARQVRIMVTVVMTIGLVTLAIHTFRFLPSPEAAHPLSQLLAILLLAALVSAYPVILRYIWHVWKPGKGII